MLILHPDLKVSEHKEGPRGSAILTTVNWKGYDFQLGSIYASNDYRERAVLFDWLRENVTEEKCAFLGDWNSVEYNETDSSTWEVWEELS